MEAGGSTSVHLPVFTEAEVAGPLEAGEVSTQLGIGEQGWQVTQPWKLGDKKGKSIKPE